MRHCISSDDESEEVRAGDRLTDFGRLTTLEFGTLSSIWAILHPPQHHRPHVVLAENESEEDLQSDGACSYLCEMNSMSLRQDIGSLLNIKVPSIDAHIQATPFHCEPYQTSIWCATPALEALHAMSFVGFTPNRIQYIRCTRNCEAFQQGCCAYLFMD